MKKTWKKPVINFFPCDSKKIQGDLQTMSNEKSLQQSIECSYPIKQYHTSPNYILREIAGESVLVSVGEGVADFRGIINLNDSAKIIWCTLQQGATKDELIQELQNHFTVSKERAAEDIEKSLLLLEERGMIVCE